MTPGSVAPVVLRHRAAVADPLGVVLGFVETYGPLDGDDPSPQVFVESDLRRANRHGARISAALAEDDLGALRRELAGRGHAVTEVRILDLLIWSAEAAARSAEAAARSAEAAARSAEAAARSAGAAGRTETSPVLSEP